MMRALCKVEVMLDFYEQGVKFVRQLCNFTFLARYGLKVSHNTTQFL